MTKRYISAFWAGSNNGGMFTNSNTPFSVAGASHALRIRHCRGDMVLKEKLLGGRNQATKPERTKECQAWVEMQNPKVGDIFQLIDHNQDFRYGVIVCVGEINVK
jgi:hypothetical protein